MTKRPFEHDIAEALVPYAHPAAWPEHALLAQCRLGKGRSSGPGGQHRNKVETLVEITHEPTGLEAHAGERRSAGENKAVALRRLRLLLATEHRVAVPLGEIGSDLWRSRVRGGKIGQDVKRASLRLSCTASQLTKLIKDHPPALARVNRARADAGLHPLR